MKVTLIGSHLCQDTLFALMKLKNEGVDVDFRNLSVDFSALKEFLHERESNPMYDVVKANNGIGMPLMIMEDGTKTFDYHDVLKKL